MAATELIVQGGKYRTDTDPERRLLNVLRDDLDLTGRKSGSVTDRVSPSQHADRYQPKSGRSGGLAIGFSNS